MCRNWKLINNAVSNVFYEMAKDLLLERRWTKSAENLGTSSFKRDLSIDTTFSQTNLAGQSL
jgi:hypothetical protein